MNTSIQRYEPSGSFSPLTFVYALMAMIAGVVLAGVYTVLIDLIPFIYVNALLTLGLGGGLGMMGVMVLTKGHCRNGMVAAGVGLLLGAAGLGASYGWSFVLSMREAAVDAGVPMMELIREVGFDKWVDFRMDGGWRVRSTEITGMGVMAIWAIEALLVLGASVMISWVVASEPYCEPCQSWTENQSFHVRGVTRDEVQPLIEQGDLPGVLAMTEPPDSDPANSLELKRHFCPQCANTAFLSVSSIRVVIVNNKEDTVTAELVEKAVMTSKLNAQYIARFAQPQAEAAPVAGAAS